KRGGGLSVYELRAFSLDVNASATTAYITDDMADGLVSYDLATGDGTLLSAQEIPSSGTGYDPVQPHGTLVLEDRSLVLTANGTALGSIAIAGGNRTVISGRLDDLAESPPHATFAAGPMFVADLSHPVYDAANDRVLLTDGQGIVAADITTG